MRTFDRQRGSRHEVVATRIAPGTRAPTEPSLQKAIHSLSSIAPARTRLCDWSRIRQNTVVAEPLDRGRETHTETLGSQDDPTTDLADRLSETASALFSATGVGDTLQRVVDLAVETIDGCDLAGIFRLEGAVVTTPVHTDPAVIEIDALQHSCGEGPCLDAVTHRVTVYADDLSDEARWPRFAAGAMALGIRSALALSLSADGASGALNLYARYPQAFGVVDRARALVLATLTGVALSSAEVHDAEERRLETLRHALVTREVIGQAKGILMERERITSDQAFDVLRRASQHLNVKLRDVAQTLVDTGERPETGSPPAPP